MVRVVGHMQSRFAWPAAPVPATGLAARSARAPLASRVTGTEAPAFEATGDVWLSADDVARRMLQGECLSIGVRPSATFADQAVHSALGTVHRWTREGRALCVEGRYPGYQFDGVGKPFAVVAAAMSLFVHRDPVLVHAWFCARNTLLGGKRPRDLLLSHPDQVSAALTGANPWV